MIHRTVNDFSAAGLPDMDKVEIFWSKLARLNLDDAEFAILAVTYFVSSTLGIYFTHYNKL